MQSAELHLKNYEYYNNGGFFFKKKKKIHKYPLYITRSKDSYIVLYIYTYQLNELYVYDKNKIKSNYCE
jgi:hypothetical protein